MGEFLTRVELHFGRDFFNYYIRFGEPRQRNDLDRRRAFEYYAPGQLFGYVRWEANEYGTRYWRIWVVRAGDPVILLHRIPGVTPGAEILLQLSGGTRVKRAFEAIDAIEALGIDPADVPASYYVQIHHRIVTRLPIPPYSTARHRVCLLEKVLFG